jgi:hypothetical protein
MLLNLASTRRFAPTSFGAKEVILYNNFTNNLTIAMQYNIKMVTSIIIVNLLGKAPPSLRRRSAQSAGWMLIELNGDQKC